MLAPGNAHIPPCWGPASKRASVQTLPAEASQTDPSSVVQDHAESSSVSRPTVPATLFRLRTPDPRAPSPVFQAVSLPTWEFPVPIQKAQFHFYPPIEK